MCQGDGRLTQQEHVSYSVDVVMLLADNGVVFNQATIVS